jgi:hypothetical protein
VDFGSVSGGTYSPSGSVAFTTLISGGLCTYSHGSCSSDPGFASHGGTYSPIVTVTGIPIQTDILGAGLL